MPSITEVLQNRINEGMSSRAFEVRYQTHDLIRRLREAKVNFRWPGNGTQFLEKPGSSNPYSQAMIENLVNSGYEPILKADVVSLGQTFQPPRQKRVIGDAYWTLAAMEASRFARQNNLLCASVGGDEFIFLSNDPNTTYSVVDTKDGHRTTWSQFLGTPDNVIEIQLNDSRNIPGELKFSNLTVDEVNTIKTFVDEGTQRQLLYRLQGENAAKYNKHEASLMFNSLFDSKVIIGLLNEVGSDEKSLDYISRVTRSRKDFYGVENLNNKLLNKVDNPGIVKFLNSIDESGKLADNFIIKRLAKYICAAKIKNLDINKIAILSNGPDLSIAVDHDYLPLYNQGLNEQTLSYKALGLWFPHLEIHSHHNWHEAVVIDQDGKKEINISLSIETLNDNLDSEFHHFKKTKLGNIDTLISLAIALAPNYGQKDNRRRKDKAIKLGIHINDRIEGFAQNIVDYLIELHNNPDLQNDNTFDLEKNNTFNYMLWNLYSAINTSQNN